ncbi:DUF7601 domain-containing protein [Desulfuribacillus alkaliarsenatis]|uniref:Gram-positive cocci surface proteins LPxTG domain-containing protein n=1 Tax=Desulfuribacillus alkaliarsenatis TaxID=766136 RepID=A0A1E5G101_9FIRM|nr:SpaA isopeptide-forming pilin-related protein [Desulfuribacillus alkaliarsenatis]OEF96573.1 hypothetical protein BHF68_07970 [Desulfuribacillus alkaliarsenatis]
MISRYKVLSRVMREKARRQYRNKHRYVATLIIMLMMFSSFVPTFQHSVYSSGTGVYDKLMDFESTVQQNGTVIEEGETLDSGDPVNVVVSFRVPVQGDVDTAEISDGDQIVKGDSVSFQLALGFTLTSGAGPFSLEFGGVTIGTLSLTTDPVTRTSTVTIDFDGDDEVYDGTWNTVICTFNATLAYDGSGGNDSVGDHFVQLLGKEFTVNIPPLPVEITGSKSGERDGQFIDWIVEVTAKQGDDDYDLDGYRFSDVLTNVGTYVEDSFRIGESANYNDATAVLDGEVLDDGNLSYVFPAGNVGTRYIFFRTQIGDDVFYDNGNKTITNTARVFDGVEEKWSGSGSVSFNIEWINKEATDINVNYVANTAELTWVITANNLGASLNDVVITDVLDSKLIFDSAEGFTWDGADWVSAGTWSSVPAGGEYDFGNISTPIQLKITAVVDTDDYNIGHTVQTINNQASISWAGYSGPGNGIGTGNVSVGIGQNPISKSAGTYNQSTHTIPWTVTVGQSDVAVNLRVLDLLVYGSSGFDVNATYTVVGNEGAGLKHVTAGNIANLTPRYNQKYRSGSFATSDGLEVVVYTLQDELGNDVADLLVVTGGGGAEIDASTSKTFTYDTIVTNPDIYAAANGNTTIYNTASLFSANQLLNSRTANVQARSHMLSKDMLTVANASDPDGNKNTNAAGNSSGFNYIDKTVVFRLHINANDIAGGATNGITAVPGTTLGAITVTDTLPAGWEFIEIETGKNFLIYEGTGHSNGNIDAGGVPSNLSFISDDFSTPGEATFTFSSLDNPYVILLKAQPTSQTVEGFFNDNKNTTVTNNVSLSAENGITSTTATQNVTINSTILSKDSPTVSDGTLTWTVEYKPYGIEFPGTIIEDTIPVGMELRTDADGVVDITDNNISAIELNLNANGSYSDGAVVPLTLGGNIHYDNATRILSFDIPDTAKAYRLTYKTDITGNSGTTLTNSVRLTNSSATPSAIEENYTVSSADVTATMNKSGWVEITKLDGNSDPLAGAVFEMLNASGQTVLRSGTTDSNGKLFLRGLPVGTYILKEVSAPAGYNLIADEYTVVVNSDNTPMASIDGSTGSDSNKITVTNYLTGTVGSIEIQKNLAGNAASTTKEFDFEITVTGLADDTYAYVGSGGKANGNLTFAGEKATFTLKGGEGITILNLPKDLDYEVSEADYSADGYSTTKSNETGTIVADATQTVSFTNTRNTGSLEIKKNLAGNAASTTKDFEFEITISGLVDGDYAYVGSGGKASGSLTFTNEIAEVILRGGEGIIISDLLEGLSYTVSEADYSAEGYSTTKSNETGTIVADATQTVSFTNTRNTGSLEINKNLAGNAASATKEFEFEITISGLADGDYAYVGSGGKASGSLTFTDEIADVILRGGEGITIPDLLEGLSFAVSEADYSAEGYSTTKSNETGTIVADQTITVTFTNTRNVFSGGGGGFVQPPQPVEPEPIVPEQVQPPEQEPPEPNVPTQEQPLDPSVVPEEPAQTVPEGSIETPPQPETPSAQIEGLIWLDLNQDGVIDDNEIGIDGVVINVYSSVGELVATTVTTTKDGVPGYYSTDNLPLGEYTIKAVLPGTNTEVVISSMVVLDASNNIARVDAPVIEYEGIYVLPKTGESRAILPTLGLLLIVFAVFSLVLIKRKERIDIKQF